MGLCDFIVTSFIDGNEVVFNVGGRIEDDLGFVGIGFTKDNSEVYYVFSFQSYTQVEILSYLHSIAENNRNDDAESENGLIHIIQEYYNYY